jgi:PAS domain S-box-containing protein
MSTEPETFNSSHSLEDYKIIFEHSPLGIFHFNEQGIITAFNENFVKILGSSREKLMGLSVLNGLTDQKLMGCIAKTLEGEVTHHEDFYSTVTSNKVVPVKCNFAPVIQNGKTLGGIGIVSDITEQKQTEESLARAKQNLERTFEAISDGIMVLDNNYTVIRVNKALIKCVGARDEKEILGRRCFEIIHGTSTPIGCCPHTKLLLDGEEHTEEVGLPEFKKILRVNVSPLTDQDGNVQGCVHVTRDITERKKAEEDLRSSEERFRLIAETTSDIIWCLDDNYHFTYVSPSARETFGVSPDEILGTSIFDLITPRHKEIVKTAVIDRRTQEENLGIRTGTVSHEVEGLHKNGNPVWTETRSTPIRDKDGRISGFVGITRNISERKKSEIKLKESERKYRALFEESRDGIYSVLRDGTILDANPSFLDIFGYTEEEMIGENIIKFYADPSARTCFQKEIESQGFAKDYEVRFLKKQGIVFYGLITASVVYGESGEIVGYRGIIRDLTIRKGLQQQLLQAQKMEAVGTLAGGIAHDFNNLLQVIQGSADLLLHQKARSDPDYKNLSLIFNAAKSGADLVRRILMFSRKSDISPLSLDLNEAINHTAEVLSRTLPKMIRIQTELSDNLPRVSADPVQIEQVLLNLAVNAGDAMPEGGSLSIKTDTFDIDDTSPQKCMGYRLGNYVKMSVSDTGPGIPPDVLTHIFEPFYTTKMVGKGSGLGLSVVYGIINHHRGYITCQSEMGRGTTFDILLPVNNSKPKPGGGNKNLKTLSGNETVLVVDDDDRVRLLAKETLETFGYTVLEASNGKDALTIYAEKQDLISLVVLDLMMPEMSGRTCLKHLLSINPSVKVIIMSGYSTEDEIQKSKDMGATNFLGKPYKIDEFMKQVREVIDRN